MGQIDPLQVPMSSQNVPDFYFCCLSTPKDEMTAYTQHWAKKREDGAGKKIQILFLIFLLVVCAEEDRVEVKMGADVAESACGHHRGSASSGACARRDPAKKKMGQGGRRKKKRKEKREKREEKRKKKKKKKGAISNLKT